MRKLRWSPAAWTSCLSRINTMGFPDRNWTSWMAQFLGTPIPALLPLCAERTRYVCACQRHVIDTHGDHVHTCKQHSGSKKEAHETIVEALQSLLTQAGLSNTTAKLPKVRMPDDTTRQGDIWVKNAHLGGHQDLIIDVSVVHEFGGDNMVDVSRNGQLRDIDPYRTLENAARRKINRYREAYASRQVPLAFIPCIVSTSGRIHAEFLRFLYILAHRRTTAWFHRLGVDAPGSDAFTWRRSEYFYHTRAALGLALAVATAKRVQVADHTLRRRCPPPPSYQDALLYPAPPPRGS